MDTKNTVQEIHEVQIVGSDRRMEIAIGSNAWWDAFLWMAQANLLFLKQFRGAPRNGQPVGMTSQEWDATIDKMIAAFSLIVRQGFGENLTDDQNKQIEDGLLEFAAHFRALWD